MPAVSKKPAVKAVMVAKAAPRTVAAKRGSTGVSPSAAKKPVAVGRSQPVDQPPLMAPVPETKKAGAGKRQRLSKAFSRPLEKLRKAKPVRERFTLPEIEYAQLAVLKKRLAERGASVKKSELVRAGLLLIAALDDDALQALLAKIPPLD